MLREAFEPFEQFVATFSFASRFAQFITRRTFVVPSSFRRFKIASAKRVGSSLDGRFALFEQSSEHGS